MSMDEIQKEESAEVSKQGESDEESMPVEEVLDSGSDETQEAAQPEADAQETDEEEVAATEPAPKGDAEKSVSNITFFDKPIEGKFQKTVVGVLSVILSPIIAALILGIAAAVVALVGVVVLLVIALAFSIVLVVLVALFFALPILIPIAILVSLITGKGKVSIGQHGVKISGK